MNNNWREVSKKFPCPICNRPSWCVVTEGATICMRMPNEHRKVFRDGSVGYVYKSGDQANGSLPPKEREAPAINAKAMVLRWVVNPQRRVMLGILAGELGVSYVALARLDCCWAREYNAWAFPMSDGYQNYVGIRLRNAEGRKWAVRGSRSGIFVPQGPTQDTAYICEGPTDLAAILTMGCWGIGRPSCSGGMYDTISVVRRLHIAKAVIVMDNDEPGVRGAQMLSDHLPVRHTLLSLPAKDVRAFFNAGGNKATLESLASQLVWRQPGVQ